jgi:hypothetical protein
MRAEGLEKDSVDRQRLGLLFEAPSADHRNNLLRCVNFLQYLSRKTKRWMGGMLYLLDSGMYKSCCV